MKTHRPTIFAALALFALGALPGQTLADNLRIPNSVLRMSQLEEAKERAAENEEPLVFLYTNPGST